MILNIFLHATHGTSELYALRFTHSRGGSFVVVWMLSASAHYMSESVTSYVVFETKQ